MTLFLKYDFINIKWIFSNNKLSNVTGLMSLGKLYNLTELKINLLYKYYLQKIIW